MGRAGAGEGTEPVDSLAGDRQDGLPDLTEATDLQPDLDRIRQINSFVSIENDKQVACQVLYPTSSS